MERFVEHTQKIFTNSQSPDVHRRCERKTIDTGLQKQRSGVTVSISPPKIKAVIRKSFSVKESDFNHFSGKRKSNVTMPETDLRGQEIKVQVGGKTLVFEYGDQENKTPRLIDRYIKKFQAKESSKSPMTRANLQKSQSDLRATKSLQQDDSPLTE